MLSAIQANSCKPVFFKKRNKNKKKRFEKVKTKKNIKKAPEKKTKKSKKKAKKKRLEKKGQKRRFEKEKKKQKKTKTSKNPGKQWNQQAMATRNARTNGKSGWQWKEACTLSWTRHSQKGVQPPRWPYPGTWAGGSNPLADPTPGPGWGDPGSKIARKKAKKKEKKKRKKSDLGGPPLPDEGVPQVSSHLHHLPGWSSQICKVSPKPSQSSCAQAPCHDPRHTLSSASSKSGMTFSAKATPSVFLLFFSNCFFFCFCFAFLLLFCLLFLAFLFAFFCFFLIVFFCFFQDG